MRSGRLACLALLAALVTAAGAPAADDSASAPQAWHPASVGKAQGVFPLGRASGRVWFVTESSQGAYTVWSARVANGRLTSLVSTAEGKNTSLPSSFLLGSSLVNCCAGQQGGSVSGSSVAPLLASGKVGAWAPLPGTPEKVAEDALIPPDQLVDGKWLARAGIALGGRTLWAITGHTCPNGSGPHQCTVNGGGTSWFAVCCATGGGPVDLSSLLTARFKGGATDVALGHDKHGRLWLAWLDRASSKPGIAFKLVQLDPSTLKPVGVHRLDHTLLYGVGAPTSFSFACADRCRLVYQGLLGAFSWGGTGKPTRLWKNNPRTGAGGFLFGAALRAGGLDVANYGNKAPGAPDKGQRLILKHGNVAGRKLRTRRSIGIPQSLPDGKNHFFLPVGVPEIAFTPTGLVAFSLYYSDRPSGPSRLLTAVLRG
jgi:hypothetical protein